MTSLDEFSNQRIESGDWLLLYHYQVYIYGLNKTRPLAKTVGIYICGGKEKNAKVRVPYEVLAKRLEMLNICIRVSFHGQGWP